MSGSASPTAPPGTRRVVIALGAAQTLAWASSYYLPAILAAPMARSLGVSAAFIFGAFSAALVGAALLGPAVGRVIDARGGRGMLALSNLVLAAGLTVLALAPGPVVLVLGWLVLGGAMAMGLYEAAFATLAGLYGRAARGPITGVTLIAGFASTIGWPITALFEDMLGWRGACLAWAGLNLLLGLPLNRLLVPPAPPPARAAAATEPTGPPPPRFAMPLLGFAFGACAFGSGAMAAHLPALLLAVGATATVAVASASLVGAAQVAARLAEFGLLRRFHPLVAARLATLGHPFGALALLLFGAAAAPAFAVLHGMGNGLLTIARGTLPLAVFGAAGYGARQGLLTAPARLAQAIAPLLFGLLLETLGAGVALLLSAGLAVAAWAALLALPTRS
jgi:MFS family permease